MQEIYLNHLRLIKDGGNFEVSLDLKNNLIEIKFDFFFHSKNNRKVQYIIFRLTEILSLNIINQKL